MSKTPTFVTGGCLCERIRYRVDFAPEHDFERASHTCQCTQCRRWSGALVLNFHTVTVSELQWLGKSTYAEYQASPNATRAFCNKCGSTIGWIDHALPEDIELTTGTFDEEFLLGKRDGEDRAQGAYADALASPLGDHFHLRNAIEATTGSFTTRGRRFWEGSKGRRLD